MAGRRPKSISHPQCTGCRNFIHHRVNHSAGEYVRDFCLHTNGIESAWALFKRQVIGILD
jgi:hypothetical protein